MPCSLMQELMLYKLKLGHDDIEATQDINYAKSDDTIDQ